MLPLSYLRQGRRSVHQKPPTLTSRYNPTKRVPPSDVQHVPGLTCPIVRRGMQVSSPGLQLSILPPPSIPASLLTIEDRRPPKSQRRPCVSESRQRYGRTLRRHVAFQSAETEFPQEPQ